jgi:multidrug efflux pump
MTGLVGRMFREFALTLTIAVVTSAIVSLTLTPMMCSRLLRYVTPGRENRVARLFNGAVEGTVEVYRRTLGWVLGNQGLTLLVTLVTLAATVWLYVIVPKGFLPQQDTGLITAVAQAGSQVSIDEMRRLQEQAANAIRSDPDVTGVVSVIGVSPINPSPTTVRLTITLKPRDERRALAGEIVNRLQRLVAPLPGLAVYFLPVQDIQISTKPSRAQFQYTLTGTDADEVSEWSAKLVTALRHDGTLRDVSSEAQEGGLRIFINVNREIAGRLGVSMQLINDSLYDAFGQRQISTIYGQANQYRVILEALPQYQLDPSALSKIYLPANANINPLSTASAQLALPSSTYVAGSATALAPLNAFATIERTTAPLAIMHQEQFPSAMLSFNLAPGVSLSDAVSVISSAEKSIGMPTTLAGSYSGDAAEFANSLAGQPWLILAAAVTIYIVLGVLYESFIHPLTILSTLPSAGVGALLALMVCGQDLSVIALIGIVLLMGIVKKNAIMMIDFALEAERTEGLAPREAIVKACMLRFRPIMMTTLAALFGALPLALESGTGSELRFPLGITIIGGLLVSQMLTLFTTPVIYLQMEWLKARYSRTASLDDQPELPLAGGMTGHAAE